MCIGTNRKRDPKGNLRGKEKGLKVRGKGMIPARKTKQQTTTTKPKKPHALT